MAARLGATAESIGLLGMSFLQDVKLAQQEARVIKDWAKEVGAALKRYE